MYIINFIKKEQPFFLCLKWYKFYWYNDRYGPKKVYLQFLFLVVTTLTGLHSLDQDASFHLVIIQQERHRQVWLVLNHSLLSQLNLILENQLIKISSTAINVIHTPHSQSLMPAVRPRPTNGPSTPEPTAKHFIHRRST